MATQTLALTVRVSRVGDRDEEGDRFFTEREQITDGTKAAEQVGYAVEVYRDMDVSGATPFADRPGMGQALLDLEAGKVAGIVSARRDRLVRQDPAAGVTLAALQERIRAAGGILIVGDTPEAWVGIGERPVEGFAGLGLDMMVALDGRFREEARKRWRAANADAIRRGVQPGRTPPWLDRDEKTGLFSPNEHTPAVVEAVRARAAGASWSEVAAILNERGVPTAKAKNSASGWTFKTAERLCRSELLVGRVRWGDYRNDHAFEPLVDEATWLLASARRERPRGWRDREPGLATGVATCASCGHRMIQDSSGTRRGGKQATYRCRSGACGAPATITHAKLEPYLWERAMTEVDRRMQAEIRLEEDGLLEPAEDSRPSQDELTEALRAAEAEVAAFLRNVPATTPGYSEAIEARMAIVEAAKRRLAESAAPRQPTFAEQVEAGFAALDDPAWRRAQVLLVVEEARITKGSAPVEEKVEIVYRAA
jgi:DNA invertase Pin-like site-specific DNA recombinase